MVKYNSYTFLCLQYQYTKLMIDFYDSLYLELLVESNYKM